MTSNLLSPAQPTLDLAFLVHTSPKITDYEYAQIQDFIQLLVRGGNIDSGDVRVSLSIYRKRGRTHFSLDAYSNMADVIEGISSYQSTSSNASLADGLNHVSKTVFSEMNGERKFSPNALIVLTDTMSNMGRSKMAAVNRAMRTKDTAVYAIGVNMVDMSELESVVSNPRFLYRVNNTDDLMGVRERLVADIPARKPSMWWSARSIRWRSSWCPDFVCRQSSRCPGFVFLFSDKQHLPRFCF